MTKMLVETYETTELTSTMQENVDEQQIALIKSLGLKGQEGLISANNESPAVSPYRRMTEGEYRVFNQLLTAHSRVEDFSGEAIPLRVLQVIAHARELGTFGGLWIWSEPSAAAKDPLLVALPLGKNEFQGEWFILARWGEVLQPIEVLEKKAAKIAKTKWMDALRKIASTATQTLAAEKDTPDESFLGRDMPVAYGYR